MGVIVLKLRCNAKNTLMCFEKLLSFVLELRFLAPQAVKLFIICLDSKPRRIRLLVGSESWNQRSEGLGNVGSTAAIA